MHNLKVFEMFVVMNFKGCTKKGVDAYIYCTKAVTEDDECKLWESGVLNIDTPMGLFNCVFFYNRNFDLEVVKNIEV